MMLCVRRDSPAETTPKAVTEEMATQRMVAGIKLRKAPHIGDIGANDFKCGSSQLFGRSAFFVILIRV